MILSTLCYIEKDRKYLMLHRTKKKNDINKDKWLGKESENMENEVKDLEIQYEISKEEIKKLIYTIRGKSNEKSNW